MQKQRGIPHNLMEKKQKTNGRTHQRSFDLLVLLVHNNKRTGPSFQFET